MEWFFIEAAVALAVGIAIVWWTMAPQRKLPPKKSSELPTGSTAESDAGSQVD